MTDTISNGLWRQDLPKIEVPDLHKTIERYLASLKPVIPCAQFEQTLKTVDLFLEPDGDGQRLQALLLKYAENVDNWVTEIWLDDMYLGNPLPLPINSNPFCLFPRQQFRSTVDLFRFAARIIQFAHNFKKQIDTESLPQDYGSGHGNGAPLCMQTYKHFFTACRIPGEEKDHILINNAKSDYIVVACRNQFFVLRLKTDDTPDEEELVEQLRLIWYLSKEYETKTPTPAVGLLTTENRRHWAAVRNNLIKRETNKQSLHYLERCLYVLCLDDSVSAKAATAKNQRRDSAVDMAKMEPAFMCSQLLHGGGSDYYTGNRFFDKFLQIIVGRDGICGIVCEHSASEGITVLRFMEDFVTFLKERPVDYSMQRKDSVKGSLLTKNNNLLCSRSIVRLLWDLDDATLHSVQDAAKKVNKLIEDFDMYVLCFKEFGKSFIKQQKMSPDCFIQLALQLTYYKVHRRLVSTYESASLRQFKDGRVDNIRANTVEALAWARAMCDEIPEITETHKLELFQKAIRKQNEILKYTISGQGADNHLLALKEMAKRNNLDMPLLFREKAYKEYLNFRLSTSQLPNDSGITVGYGAVVPDGYGISYTPNEQQIIFCIASFYSSPETSSDFFAFSLEGSLLQMRELCIKLKAQKENLTTQIQANQ